MRVYDFIEMLQDALDENHAAANREVIVTFIAPHSGFCGPTVRPKFLGYPSDTTVYDGEPMEARYGLDRLQIERILTAFDVTLPVPEDFA